MATYTANYQLHQWVPEDNFLRTDFNQDFQKLDTAQAEVEALAGSKCSVVAGTYSGNNAESREINLGFQPVAVMLENSYGRRPAVDYGMYGGLAVQGGSVAHANTALEITQTGFRVGWDGNSLTNYSGNSYRYLAFRAGG